MTHQLPLPVLQVTALQHHLLEVLRLEGTLSTNMLWFASRHLHPAVPFARVAAALRSLQRRGLVTSRRERLTWWRLDPTAGPGAG